MPTLAPPAPGVKPRRPRAVRPPTGTARLTLHLNGTAYAVRVLTPDPAAGVSRLVRLRKADGRTYYVAMTETGPTCDCPSQTWDHEGNPSAPCCKHIAGLRAASLL